MSKLSLNGQDLDLGLGSEITLRELVDQVRKNVTTEQVLVSEIRVNGLELTPSREEEFAEIPFADLQSVEVLTTYSRELIDDTLQHLLEYATYLEGLSKRTSLAIGQPEFNESLFGLIDGLKTLAEGISSITQMLKIGSRPEITKPEKELLNILQELLNAYQKKDDSVLTTALNERLPQNLETWRNSGIPHLVYLSSS